MSTPLSETIVFITGAFIGNNCWDEWKTYFESHGYSTLAPAWPHKESYPEELRHRQPDAALASIRLADLTAYFEAIIEALPAKPVLIGHSLGGLIVQILLQRGLGTAGIAIHSFPPRSLGIFRYSFIKQWWDAMGFFGNTREPYLMHFIRWKYSVVNGMTCEQQKESYYAYLVPESKKLVRDAFISKSKIDYRKPHPPLLFISGSRDQLIPASQNRSNFKKYENNSSITDYKTFSGTNHLIFGDSMGTQEADFILFWLKAIKT
jgi:pimeloyl-ACP methyl ester carboxylesterase